MQTDQTVLSLRPGGGSRGGTRFLFPRFDPSSEANTDLPVLLRPHGGGASYIPSFKTGESRFHGLDRICYTRDQLLRLREMAIIAEDILKAKQEVDTEFFGEDPSWARGESNLQNQGQNRYSQPDNRDWRNLSAQFPAPAEERSWERQQDINQQNRQEQLSSQFARTQISSNLESSTSPLKTLPSPVTVPPPSIKVSSSKPSGEGTLPAGQESLVAQSIEELPSSQGVDPPCVESEEIFVNLPVEPTSSDKGKSPWVVGSTNNVPQFSKAADEGTDAILRSIQDLFTFWEKAKRSATSHSPSASRPSVSSTAFSEENMNVLKQSVLEYVSFMDMNISKASVSSQRDKFEHLSAKMAQALELPSLNISSDFKLTLKIIHSEISSLLARNVELEAKKTQYIHDVNEKESLFQEIEKANVNLNEMFSEVMVEDSLMVSLAVKMKELQAMMDDCKTRLVAKQRTASQEVERSKSLVERYSELEVNEDFMTELSTASTEQDDEWGKLRERMRSLWGKL